MEEARRGTSTVTRRVGIIKPKINSKVINMQMDILRVTMGFTLLIASGCVSVTRVAGLIPHIPLDYIIHGPPV